MAGVDHNRVRILECAKELIKTEGFNFLTVPKITKRCSISNRTFYKVFPSKTDLISELEKLSENESLDIIDERKVIIEKAKESFAKNGYSKIDMNAIARAAGTTRAAIYRYFKTKDELLGYCILHELDMIKQNAVEIMAYAADPLSALEGFITGFCHFIDSSYESALFTETYNHAPHNEDLRKYTKELQDFFIDIFKNTLEAGMRQGIFRDDIDTEGVAIVMLTALYGFPLFARVDPSIDMAVRIRDNTLTLMRNTILKN